MSSVYRISGIYTYVVTISCMHWYFDLLSPNYSKPFYLVKVQFYDLMPLILKLQMAEYFNKKSGISGRTPLGSFNAMFNFTGSWQVDAAATKSLAMVGYFIPLYKVKLEKVNLLLHEEIKRAVPYSWDPAALAK